MNQEQNNFNPSNATAPINNGLPNNQPLNNPVNQSYSQNVNYNFQPVTPKKSSPLKVLGIVLGCIVGFIILIIVLISIVSASSNKLVCKSNQGNITIMYNDKSITGYTAVGVTYDLDGQQRYAERIGIEAYIQEFSTWFGNNTSGSCTIEEK